MLEMTAERFPSALEAHSQRVNDVCLGANTDRAEATIQNQIKTYADRYVERNEVPAPADVVAQVTARYREQYDHDLRQRATTLEQEHTEIGRAIEAAIVSSRVLPTWVEIAPENDMRAVRFYIELDRAERKVTGLTRRAVRELYERASDDGDRTLVTLIERNLSVLPLQDDPVTDAVEVSRLQQAIAARQEARVPQWLRDAQTRHGEIRSLHFDHLHRHLTREQRGIATAVR
jgi:hypothetical protein